MFFRTCNLENCLNHKRIKQRPTCKTKPNLITNACDALRGWIKRVERVLRLFSRQLWIKALTFSSPASWGLSLSWHVHGLEFAEALTERLLYCETSSVPQEPSGKLSQLHVRHINFPQSVRISKAQSTTFSLSNRQCFKWHIVQKTVYL